MITSNPKFFPHFCNRIFCFFTAYCGILFPSREEAAYSNFRLWESLGYIIAYAYSVYLCAAVKVYILIALLIIGMVGYLVVEWQEKKKLREKAIQWCTKACNLTVPWFRPLEMKTYSVFDLRIRFIWRKMAYAIIRLYSAISFTMNALSLLSYVKI